MIHPPNPGTLRAFLRRDHARIEGLYDELLDTFVRDASAVRRAWQRFESALLDHMATEERLLLAPYAKTRRREAADLRDQHAAFRRALARAAASPTLHREDLQKLITAILAHARREDSLLYEWAEQELDRGTQERIAREFHAL